MEFATNASTVPTGISALLASKVPNSSTPTIASCQSTILYQNHAHLLSGIMVSTVMAHSARTKKICRTSKECDTSVLSATTQISVLIARPSPRTDTTALIP
jgi:hypothetical protein